MKKNKINMEDYAYEIGALITSIIFLIIYTIL
jgi:hypothetical protein